PMICSSAIQKTGSKSSMRQLSTAKVMKETRYCKSAVGTVGETVTATPTEVSLLALQQRRRRPQLHRPDDFALFSLPLHDHLKSFQLHPGFIHGITPA